MKYKDKVQKKCKANRLIEEFNPWGYRISYKWVPDGYRYYGPVFRFRYDPVPGTGGTGKVHIRGCYRAIRTTQERRWALAHKEYVRGKRSYRMLPEAWDDIHHARREKGWKRTKKKKQWMR